MLGNPGGLLRVRGHLGKPAIRKIRDLPRVVRSSSGRAAALSGPAPVEPKGSSDPPPLEPPKNSRLGPFIELLAAALRKAEPENHALRRPRSSAACAF